MTLPASMLGLAVLLLAGTACSAERNSPAQMAAAGPAAPAAVATPALAAAAASPASAPAPQLQAALRGLWHGHVVHTRDYALAVHAGDRAAASAAAKAVVANARQISDAVAGFYGPGGGERMFELLGGHWGAVKALTDADDGTARKQAISDLTANAGEIAGFLSGANPHLPEDVLRGLLVAHGGHHVQQVQQVMAGDTQGEAATWTAMQAHMDVIADALAAAIARQFPDKAA